MRTHRSPGRIVAECPISACGHGPLSVIFISPTSETRFVPNTVALASRPSGNETLIFWPGSRR